MLMPMCGRCVTSGCALEKGECEHLAPCDLVDTFVGPLVRVDRDKRYAAEWHDRVDRDGYAEGRLRRVTPSFQPLEGRAGLCSS
jgi:hypothetical protein